MVAVSVDGKIVHQTGFGYSDVENRILAVPETVMRIASISKPITMTAAAKLWEQGKLDLDKPIQHYVPDWPSKVVDGEEVKFNVKHGRIQDFPQGTGAGCQPVRVGSLPLKTPMISRNTWSYWDGRLWSKSLNVKSNTALSSGDSPLSDIYPTTYPALV